MTIPKNITDKIKAFNTLRDEIKDWLEENVDTDGFEIPDKFRFTDHPKGKEQDDGEYCAQHSYGICEDSFEGQYYFPTEEGEYLVFDFWV